MRGGQSVPEAGLLSWFNRGKENTFSKDLHCMRNSHCFPNVHIHHSKKVLHCVFVPRVGPSPPPPTTIAHCFLQASCPFMNFRVKVFTATSCVDIVVCMHLASARGGTCWAWGRHAVTCGHVGGTVLWFWTQCQRWFSHWRYSRTHRLSVG